MEASLTVNKPRRKEHYARRIWPSTVNPAALTLEELTILSIATFRIEDSHKKGLVRGRYTNIASAVFKGNVENYKPAVRGLVGKGIIEVNETYSAGQDGKKGFCKSYRMAKAHRNSDIVLNEVKVRKPRPNSLPDASRVDCMVEQYILENYKKVEVNPAALERILTSGKVSKTAKKKCYDAAQKIEAKIVNLKRGKNVKRLYSTFTSVPKVMLPALHVGGRNLVEVDVKTCQPALLMGICPESEKAGFAALLSRDFYATLSKSPRDKAKKEFGQFAFGKYRRKNSIGEAIRAQFPGLFAAIKSYNGSDLSRMLQNVEAELCIDSVGVCLMNEGIFFLPRHDAFFCFAQDAARVSEVIREAFTAALGFEVGVSVKG